MAAGSQGYFQKKTEVTELRKWLANPDVQHDRGKYCRAVRSVISCMTLGIDVAPLFTEMIKASATNNLVQKKLVYLYLSTYAETHPQDAILIINTLCTDASDQNAMIRGLALRSMSSLRIPDLVVHIQTPVVKCLEDRSPYVRSAAVLGCLKLYYLAQETMTELGLVDKLYRMLRDPDLQVVSNCIAALDEILAPEGGMAVNQKIAYYLLNRLGKFSEWAQCLVMEVLMRYRAISEDEIFDILNILDDRLKHNNSAVILAAIKLFLHFTTNVTYLHSDIYQRIKSPMLSILASCGPEVSYTCLCHIKLMLDKDTQLFANEYKTFFCRHTDPCYVKYIKLEILTTIASCSNVQEIVEELSAYVADIQVEMSHHSVQAIAKIALLFTESAEFCCNTLIQFLSWDIDHIRNETFVALKDILVKYPHLSESIAPLLTEDLEFLHDPRARAAVVWMLGEFGELIDGSPYLLESLIDEIKKQSTEVKLQLLTSTAKMFFKKPPQCQAMLGRLLEYCIDEEGHMDVRDRALLYYRLLSKSSIDQARDVICPIRDAVVDVTAKKGNLESNLFREFNTLSVLYGQHSSTFISQIPTYTLTRMHELCSQDMEDSPRQVMLSDASTIPPIPSSTSKSSSRSTSDSSNVAVADLLGGGFAVEEEPSAVIELKSRPSLTPSEFEQQWEKIKNKDVLEVTLTVIPGEGELEQTMLLSNIYTIAATPPNQRQRKFYFFAKHASQDLLFLIEANISGVTSHLKAVIKSDNSTQSQLMLQHFKNSLVGRWLALHDD